MTATVRWPIPSVHKDADAGKAIRAPTWGDMARIANSVLGRGAQLIPAYYPGVQLTKASDTFRWRVTPRFQSRERVWVIFGYSVSGAQSNTLSVTTGGGSAVDYPMAVGQDAAQPIIHVETRSAQADDEEELTMTLSASNDDFVLTSVSCFEMPRATLATGNDDDGIDETRLLPEERLVAPGGGGAVASALDNNSLIGRRIGHLMWAVTDNTDHAFSVTATTATLFALDAAMLGRALNLDNSTSAAATTNQLACRVRGQVSSGGVTGQYDIAMASGDSGSISITSTAWAWHPDPATADPLFIDVDSEDITAADGLRSSTWDEATQELKRTAGSGSDAVYVSAICIWET